MKKLEDYVNFALYDLTNYNYVAADNDGEVWAFTELPEFYPENEIYDVHNSSYGINNIGLGKLLTEQQVKELEERIIEIPKLDKLSNLYSIANGDKFTLNRIFSTMTAYDRKYICSVLQNLDSTITTLSLELKDERVARSKLSKELKLIAQELE